MWLHLSSHRTGSKEITARMTKEEFYDMLVKWNSQGGWIYAPIGA
jgi:hypothetical protein